MAINPADAAAAYRANASALPKGLDDTGGRTGDSSGSHFVDLVKSAAQNAVDANRQAEKLSVDAIAGKADLTEVVAAVAHAESTLQTVVTVRDRIISAYQEIMRMPI